MKISELTAALSAVSSKHGDVEVMVNLPDYDSFCDVSRISYMEEVNYENACMGRPCVMIFAEE